jgi:hypothetical protein
MGFILLKRSGKWFRESEGPVQKKKVLALPHISEAIELLKEGFYPRIHIHSSEIRIGSCVENEVVVDDLKVPDTQCIISQIEGEPVLDAVEGTTKIVRGTKIIVAKKPTELLDGDILEFGRVSLQVKLEE